MIKTLKITDEQRASIERMNLEAQATQLKMSTYMGGILDQHNLKGTWNVVSVTDKGIQVERK